MDDEAVQRWTRAEDGEAVDALLERLEPRSLAGVLGDGRFVRPFVRRRLGARIQARPAEGFAWLGMRGITQRWYPQGVDVVPQEVSSGTRALAVTWFEQRADRTTVASRVTLVTLEGVRRRVDVHLVVAGPDPEPATLHAGGIAWLGDRLLVAGSGKGVWEFHVADLAWDPHARRLVLPRRAVLESPHGRGVKASFIGTVHASASTLLVGEFAEDDRGRLGTLLLDETGATLELTRPGIPRMQGAVGLPDGRLAVSSSHDARRRGDLWIGEPGALERRATRLLPGPEDLAFERDRGLLWALSEHPWRRYVYAVRV